MSLAILTRVGSLVLASLLCVACSGINTLSSRTNTVGGSSGFGYTQIGDVFLNDQVQVTDLFIDEARSPRVFKVKLRNFVWFDIVMEVKMDFYDESGAKLDNPWGWKPLTLEGKQDDWVEFMAPNEHARHFKLYMQKAGN